MRLCNPGRQSDQDNAHLSSRIKNFRSSLIVISICIRTSCVKSKVNDATGDRWVIHATAYSADDITDMPRKACYLT